MAVKTFNIAVLPGDGVGIEVMAEAVRVLRAVESTAPQVRFVLQEYAAGAGAYLRGGEPLSAAVLDACRQADAVLLGAMGLPDVRWPDGREMTPQIDLRESLDLYCGLRPVRLYHADHSPLKGYQSGDLDLVIVRESTEGLFSTRREPRQPDALEVRDTLRITRFASERLFHAAFRLARTRRKKLTLVDKANVLPSMVFFRAMFDRIAEQYPDVQAERIYVDAAALYLVRRPETLDVIVTENMFGDILSDLAAGLVGGMGLAPSADIGERCAVFQPAHGTAPDIAGRGIANPIAMILSTAMMLEWLDHVGTRRAAAQIRQAVERTLADANQRTPDLGGSATTREMADAVLANLSRFAADER